MCSAIDTSIHRGGTLHGQRYLSLGRKARRDGSCTQNAAEERSCSGSYRFRHCDLLSKPTGDCWNVLVRGRAVGRPHISRLKISHRLFAARCVAAIIDRGRLLSRRYCPKPRLCHRCLRVAHDAPDYWPARVTEPHIVVVLVPKVGTTAFSCRYKNKLCVIDVRMY